MLPQLLFALTRIVLTLLATGGFFISIYLIPLLITYTYETLATSVIECFVKIGSIVLLHFLAPIALLYVTAKPDTKTGGLLLLYGLLMGGMYYVTGLASLAIGGVMALLGIYFIATCSFSSSKERELID